MPSPHVLIVEDDLIQAQLIAQMLDPLGVCTEVVGTVKEALASADAHPFDVAVLDLCLPDGDGASLLAQLQRCCPNAEAVFVTGNASVESAAAALRTGATDYLVKPFAAEQLLESVRAALKRGATQDELGARLRDGRIAAVSTLSAGLAHELRNPLNSAMLQLTVARRRVRAGSSTGEGAETVAACLEDAERELHRLARILTDFEACLTPELPARSPVDLDALLHTVLRELRPAIDAQGVRVSLEIDAPPTLHAHPQRVQQALLQLVRNAVEAMPAGGTLTLRARCTGAAVEIDVEDTGVGVTDVHAIFDPFFTTKTTGTGLGLTVAHRAAIDHGGSIRVRSRPGHTCFTLSLPLT